MGRTEEDQSHGFAGGRIQRYAHTICLIHCLVKIVAALWLCSVRVSWVYARSAKIQVCCSSITPSLPVQCEQFHLSGASQECDQGAVVVLVGVD